MGIRFKAWLEKKGEVVAGEGKVRLLQLFDRHGSIQKTAQENGMSYLFFAGVELALVVRDIKLRRENLFVMLATAGTAMWNMGGAYLAGPLFPELQKPHGHS